MVAFPHIQLSDRLSYPVIRDFNFKDCVVITQSNIVVNVIGTITDRTPNCHLLFRIYNFVGTIAEQKLCLYIPRSSCHHFFAPNSFNKDAVSKEL